MSAESTSLPALSSSIEAVGSRLLEWKQGGYYWGDAIAYDGLLNAAPLLDNDWAETLAGRLARWNENAVDSFDDALAPGYAAARLVQVGLLDESALRRIVQAVSRLETTRGIPLLRPQVPQWRDLVWVDSLYHVPSGLVAAGRLWGEDELIQRGVDIAAATIAVLKTDTAIGHAFDGGLGRATGIDWTRGIGWAMLGLFDVLELAPDQASAAGLDRDAQRLFNALTAAQRGNGSWPSVLGAPEADDETSVNGFWLAAAYHPARLGRAAGEDVSSAAKSALTALEAKIEPDGTVLGVSHDTHVTWSVEDYLHPATLPSPWGQGAALRGLAAAADTQVPSAPVSTSWTAGR